MNPSGSRHSTEGGLPTSPACRQYACHPGSGRSRIATAAVSPGTSTRAALRSSISTGRPAVARATALARWEADWAAAVAGVPPTASAPTSAHRTARTRGGVRTDAVQPSTKRSVPRAMRSFMLRILMGLYYAM